MTSSSLRAQSPSSSVSGKSNETSNSPMEQHQSRALSVASTATPDSNSHSDDTSWSPYAITNRFDAGRISTSSMSPNNVPTYHRPIHYDGDYASSASASFTPLSAALPFIVAGDDLKSHVQNTHTGNNNSFFQQTRMPSFSCNDLSPGLFNSSKNASDCVLNSTMGTSFNLPQNRYSHSSSKPFAALPPSVLNQLLYELQQQQQLQQQILLQKSALQDATKQRAFSEQIRALGNTSGLNLEGLHGGLGINSLRNLPVTVQQELLLLQSSFIH